MWKKTLFLIFTVSFAAIVPTSKTLAYNGHDVGKLTTLAAIYGRAVACGVTLDDLQVSMEQAIKWHRSTFGSDSDAYSEMFKEVMRQNAQSQATGKTSESCESVLKSYRSISF